MYSANFPEHVIYSVLSQKLYKLEETHATQEECIHS